MKIFESIRQLVPWALPIKFILGFIAAAFGGAGLLSFLTEYATYTYAIHYGLRLPLEGIPYLKAAVGFGSLFVLASGTMVFMLAYLTIQMMLVIAHTQFIAFPVFKRAIAARRLSADRIDLNLLWAEAREEARKSVKAVIDQPIKKVIGGSVGMFIFFYAFLASPGYLLAGMTPSQYDGNFWIILGGLSASFFHILMCRPDWASTIGAIIVITYFSTLAAMLFYPPQYAKMLRVLGYGGGLPITVQTREPSLNDSTSGLGLLMMRTSESFVLFIPEDNRIIEIPREQVKLISHSTGGLYGLPAEVPD